VCIAVAAAQSADSQAVIIKQTADINPDGSYQNEYETSNGIKGSESGVGGQYAQGSSSYYAPDGQLISLTYTVDENGGYQPQGAHLPTPPPIPAAILKALEYIRTHPQQETKQAPNSRPFQG
jgi:hypothetical protein